MKLFTVASTIAAFSLLNQVDANAEYRCPGNTFTAHYIHTVAAYAWRVELNTHGSFPQVAQLAPQSSGYGPARQFPLLPASQIWQGGSYRHVVISNQARTVLEVYEWRNNTWEFCRGTNI
ncbi:unnamed protein product [Blumeria hordei]|uniref:Uncharacterized protein n=1 Tax=Blumeria hordei TaxID=2867405 RepID=A0A383V120_BLUHO|nr:unnamed protein product [Blumeria hordei]